MTTQEEQNIIKLILSGKTELFESLVKDNQNKVYGLALKLLKNKSDALDISQEAFLKAYSGLSGFRGDSRFSVWLYRLTYNMCIDFLRKKRRESVLSLSDASSDEDAEELNIPDFRYNPETELERKETRQAIRQGIDRLPEKYRAILVLREISEMSYSEIGNILGISEGTVKSRLSRARLQLAKLLCEDGTFSGTERQKDRKEAE